MKVKWGLITLTILFVAWGIFALAAEYGTQSDPLVSLSYITDVFRPDLLKRAENESKSRAAEVQSTVDRFDQQVDAKVSEFADRNTAQVDSTMIDAIAAKVRAQVPQQAISAPFATVTLAAGKTLTLKAGCEVLLRVGSASVQSQDNPALIDLSDGGTVNSGASLVKNHLYMSTIEGRTITAGAGTVKLLVRGGYTLG